MTLLPLDIAAPMRDDLSMTDNRSTPRSTFSYDDALLAIALFALALRDSPIDPTDIDCAINATDSTLDEMQLDLDSMLDHDALDFIDDDDLALDPDFSTFPSAIYRDLSDAARANADAANADAMMRLSRIALDLANLRP